MLLPESPFGWAVAVVAAVLGWLLLHGEDEAGAASADDGADRPTCRICYAGSEAGRLFSPCLCSGTMGLVHVNCLNEWRTQSANPRSFYTCEQCGYSYRTQRTAAADALQSDWCVLLASTLVLGGLVAAGAAVPGQPEEWLYQAAAWSPRSDFTWWGEWCDRLVAGAMLPAVLGFAYEVRERSRRDSIQGTLALLAIVNVAQAQLGPGLLAACFAYFWCKLSGQIRGLAKTLLVRFGEAVLEVSR